MDCGPDAVCVGGGCFIDPASRWNVVLETLTVAATRYDGVGWDTVGGNPDPYVAIFVGSDMATPMVTSTADDTYAVAYDGTPTVSGERADRLETYLGFLVMDSDSPLDDEAIGGCSWNFTGPEYTGALQTLTCPLDAASGNSGFTLTWRLERF